MVFHKTFTCWLREREGQRLCCLGSKLGRERDRKYFAMPSSTIPRLTFVYVKSIRALSPSISNERTRTRRGRTTYEIRAVGMEVNKKEVMISSSELGRKTS